MELVISCIGEVRCIYSDSIPLSIWGSCQSVGLRMWSPIQLAGGGLTFHQSEVLCLDRL